MIPVIFVDVILEDQDFVGMCRFAMLGVCLKKKKYMCDGDNTNFLD